MLSRFQSTFFLLFGGALATAGWAAVFPFLYADISTTRGLGSAVAAATFTAFAIGSIAAAPVAGWLADNLDPARVAVAARLGLASFIVLLAYANEPVAIWAAAVGFGASLAIAQPAVGVLLLARTAAARRRDVFAWQFVALNLGTAAGAAAGGMLVDLSSRTSMRRVYLLAALASLVASFLVPKTLPQHRTGGASMSGAETVSYREILAGRQVRWLLGVALLITLACYAQYDSGLPAYLLSATKVSPAELGSAVAINALLVAVLTAPVVAMTRTRSATSLLATCAALWVGCWLMFGLPLFVHGLDVVFLFAGFSAMSIGETMMAPILSSLAAAMAPAGATGRTMAAVTGATTVATAIGPILAGSLLGLHLPAGFIGLQIVCCLAAVLAAKRLSRVGPDRAMPELAGGAIVAGR